MTSIAETTSDADEIVESRSSIPLNQLQLLPPATTASVPSKSVKPLIEHEGLPNDIALLLDAAQADIGANYPPQRYRLTTPVGYIHVVAMRLLTTMVMVAAFNLRDAAGRKRHLTEERRAGRPWQPDFGLPKPAPRGGPGCVVEIESRDQLDYWLRWERSQLVDPKLREWIAEDTVLDATLIQPVQFVTGGGDETWALVAMDGSRRITNALDAMRPAVQGDPSLVLAHCADGDLRTITATDVKALRKANLFPTADAPSPLFPASKKDEDVEAWLPTVAPQVGDFHRARTIPANVVVGFEPFLDSAGQAVGTITDAIDALLRQKHVQNARPKEWSRGDNSVLIGTRALSKLEDTLERNPVTRRLEPVLDSAAAEVLIGQTAIGDAVKDDGQLRFRDPLHALALLAATLGTPLNSSQALKSVNATMAEWRQPRSAKARALIAADMAVHVIGVPEKDVAQVVAALGGLFIGREFRDAEIKLEDGRTWHNLLDDFDLADVRENAAAERAADHVGPWSILQSLYGGLALIINPDGTSEGESWNRLTQTGRGKGNNNATPDAIVRTMVETVEGHQLLASAAEQVADRLARGSAAPMVSLVIPRGDGPDEELTESRLRELWDPNADTRPAPGPTPGPARDRATSFQLKCQALLTQVTRLLQEINEIEGMTDELGANLLGSRGVEPTITNQVNNAAMKLMGFAGMGSQVWGRSSAGPTLESVEREDLDIIEES
jgi:hypothetical protein